MSERSKETVLKTVEVQASASSNLALPAIRLTGIPPVSLFVAQILIFWVVRRLGLETVGFHATAGS